MDCAREWPYPKGAQEATEYRCEVCVEADAARRIRAAAAELDRLPRLREAAEALVAKLAAIHDDPAYQAVWQISQMHVGQYRGPKYDKELARLTAALETPTP